MHHFGKVLLDFVLERWAAQSVGGLELDSLAQGEAPIIAFEGALSAEQATLNALKRRFNMNFESSNEKISNIALRM